MKHYLTNADIDAPYDEAEYIYVALKGHDIIKQLRAYDWLPTLIQKICNVI